MGLNLSQIINKFVPMRPHSTTADGWEDPFGSGRGHVVVSESEQMKKRMARLGQIKTLYSSNKPLTASTPYNMYTYVPTTGFIGVPLKMSMTMNSSGLITIQWDSRPNQSTEVSGVHHYYTKYLPSAGTWDLDLSGEISIYDTCQMQIQYTADNAGVGYWSMIYAEELI